MILLLLLLLLLLLPDGATIDAMLLLTSGPQTCGFSRIFVKVSRVGSVGFPGQRIGGVVGDWYTDTPNNISTRAVLLGIYSTFVMADHLIS